MIDGSTAVHTDISVEKSVGMCYNTPKTDKRRAAYAAGSVS